MLNLCAAHLKFWFQTDLGRENSASGYKQGPLDTKNPASQGAF